ncbi:MAG: hypothetical protein Q9210_001372 [Variospora velana]
MTMGRKLFLEAWLRKKARSSGRPAADFWWHECRHTYGDIKVNLRIGLFLYDGTESSKYQKPRPIATNIYSLPPTVGELGVLLEYNHTYPAESQSSSPRLPLRYEHSVASLADPTFSSAASAATLPPNSRSSYLPPATKMTSREHGESTWAIIASAPPLQQQLRRPLQNLLQELSPANLYALIPSNDGSATPETHPCGDCGHST